MRGSVATGQPGGHALSRQPPRVSALIGGRWETSIRPIIIRNAPNSCSTQPGLKAVKKTIQFSLLAVFEGFSFYRGNTVASRRAIAIGRYAVRLTRNYQLVESIHIASHFATADRILVLTDHSLACAYGFFINSRKAYIFLIPSNQTLNIKKYPNSDRTPA